MQIPDPKKILQITFLTAIFFFSITQHHVHAELKAESTYEVKIEITPEKEAVVEYNIHLVNQSEKFFIRDYSMICNHTDIDNIKVSENGQSVDFSQKDVDTGVNIKITLAKELLHKNDSTDIYIKYNTSQIYGSDGLLEKIHIPPLKTEEKLNKVNFTLTVPKDFADFSYISLEKPNLAESQDNKTKVLKYLQQDAPSGLICLLGEEQQFEFVYTYKIKNGSHEQKRYSITLPGESIFQTTYFLNTSIAPDKILIDKSGNTLGEYIINSGEEKNIRITGFTRFRTNTEKRTTAIDEVILKKYLEETPIWQYSDQNLQGIIQKITKKESSTYENALSIYTYLVSTFSYAHTGKRKNTTDIIQDENKSLSCENFSDLFVSLARGAGIPAREVVGYIPANQSNSNLHVWAEFYNSEDQTWVGLDPCLDAGLSYYGFDNLDTNRFILAYRGFSDSKPEVTTPFSKSQKKEADNLEITVSNYKYLDTNQQVNCEYQIGKSDLSFRQVALILQIANNSQSILRLDKILIDNKEAQIISDQPEGNFYEAIFPHQKKTVFVKFFGLSNFPIEQINNYTLELFGDFGTSNLYDKTELQIKYPFTYISILLWFTASMMAFVTLTMLGLLVNKMKDKKIWHLKYKFNFGFLHKRQLKQKADVPLFLTPQKKHQTYPTNEHLYDKLVDLSS